VVVVGVAAAAEVVVVAVLVLGCEGGIVCVEGEGDASRTLLLQRNIYSKKQSF
jgi:hypothetical protein